MANGKTRNDFRKKSKFNQTSKNTEVSGCATGYEAKRDDKRKLHDSMNDASWYYQSEQLLRDSASISYNTPLGLTLPTNSVEVSGTQYPYALPGVLRCGFVPVPGICNHNADALNIAAKNIYSYIRHENSGSKNYDAPDYMLYLVCIDSLYMLFNEGQRAYGVAGYYSATNRYYPTALLTALGFDPSDLLSNLADFRAFLNTCAAKINSLCVPRKMKIFERHSWMVSRIYLDSTSTKPTAFCYVPDAYYQYEELQGAGKAKSVSRPTTLTVNQFKELFNSLFNKLNDSEDIGVMSGDTMKAFGSDLWAIVPVPADYITPIVYEEEVLMQFHNATFLGLPGTLDITQGTEIGVDAGVLKCNPSFSIPDIDVPVKAAKYAVLDTNKAEVTPADTMVYSRLTQVLPKYIVDDVLMYSKCVPTTCGTEIGTRLYLYWNELTSTGLQLKSAQLFTAAGKLTNDDKLLCQLSRIDGAPGLWFINRYVGPDGNDIGQIDHLFENLDNYTTVDEATLQRMNDCALLAEFGVPAGDGWSVN